MAKNIRKKNTIPPEQNKYSPELFKPNGLYGKWGYTNPEINTQYSKNKSVDTLETVPPRKK